MAVSIQVLVTLGGSRVDISSLIEGEIDWRYGIDPEADANGNTRVPAMEFIIRNIGTNVQRLYEAVSQGDVEIQFSVSGTVRFDGVITSMSYQHNPTQALFDVRANGWLYLVTTNNRENVNVFGTPAQIFSQIMDACGVPNDKYTSNLPTSLTRSYLIQANNYGEALITLTEIVPCYVYENQSVILLQPRNTLFTTNLARVYSDTITEHNPDNNEYTFNHISSQTERNDTICNVFKAIGRDLVTVPIGGSNPSICNAVAPLTTLPANSTTSVVLTKNEERGVAEILSASVASFKVTGAQIQLAQRLIGIDYTMDITTPSTIHDSDTVTVSITNPKNFDLFLDEITIHGRVKLITTEQEYTRENATSINRYGRREYPFVPVFTHEFTVGNFIPNVLRSQNVARVLVNRWFDNIEGRLATPKPLTQVVSIYNRDEHINASLSLGLNSLIDLDSDDVFSEGNGYVLAIENTLSPDNILYQTIHIAPTEVVDRSAPTDAPSPTDPTVPTIVPDPTTPDPEAEGPTTPTITLGTITHNSASFNIVPASGETIQERSYKFYQATVSEPVNFTVSPDLTSFIDIANLESNTEYIIKARVRNATGFSQIVQAAITTAQPPILPPGQVIPTVPTIQFLSTTTHSIQFQINHEDDEAVFATEYAWWKNNTTEPLTWVRSQTSGPFIADTLDPDSRYNFKARVQNEIGYSPVVRANHNTDPIPPDPPVTPPTVFTAPIISVVRVTHNLMEFQVIAQNTVGVEHIDHKFWKTSETEPTNWVEADVSGSIIQIDVTKTGLDENTQYTIKGRIRGTLSTSEETTLTDRTTTEGEGRATPYDIGTTQTGPTVPAGTAVGTTIQSTSAYNIVYEGMDSQGRNIFDLVMRDNTARTFNPITAGQITTRLDLGARTHGTLAAIPRLAMQVTRDLRWPVTFDPASFHIIFGIKKSAESTYENFTRYDTTDIRINGTSFIFNELLASTQYDIRGNPSAMFNISLPSWARRIIAKVPTIITPGRPATPRIPAQPAIVQPILSITASIRQVSGSSIYESGTLTLTRFFVDTQDNIYHYGGLLFGVQRISPSPGIFNGVIQLSSNSVTFHPLSTSYFPLFMEGVLDGGTVDGTLPTESSHMYIYARIRKDTNTHGSPVTPAPSFPTLTDSDKEDIAFDSPTLQSVLDGLSVNQMSPLQWTDVTASFASIMTVQDITYRNRIRAIPAMPEVPPVFGTPTVHPVTVPTTHRVVGVDTLTAITTARPLPEKPLVSLGAFIINLENNTYSMRVRVGGGGFDEVNGFQILISPAPSGYNTEFRTVPVNQKERGSLNVNITGFAPDTEYTFTAKAKNLTGAGPSSDPVTATTGPSIAGHPTGRPSPPTIAIRVLENYIPHIRAYQFRATPGQGVTSIEYRQLSRANTQAENNALPWTSVTTNPASPMSRYIILRHEIEDGLHDQIQARCSNSFGTSDIADFTLTTGDDAGAGPFGS